LDMSKMENLILKSPKNSPPPPSVFRKSIK